MTPSVVVVGAGIVGASISLHLAERGCHVTVVEAAPHAAAGATGKSWAWLNANRKRPEHYRELNMRSMDEWRQRFGQVADFCGLLWVEDDREPTAEYPARKLVGSELQQLEENLDPNLYELEANFYEQEGIAEPLVATRHFLDEAVRHSATVHFSEKVVDLIMEDKEVRGVITERGQVKSDAVVLASGTGVPDLAAKAGVQIPLLDKPAVIVRTQPLPRLLHRMLIAKGVFLWQAPDGRFLIGEVAPPDDASTTDTSMSSAKRVLDLGAAVMPCLRNVAIAECEVGYRPYPKDGYPILGVPDGWGGLYIAVTHSGATLAPLVGKLVAEELIDGRASVALRHYRPSRTVVEGDASYTTQVLK